MSNVYVVPQEPNIGQYPARPNWIKRSLGIGPKIPKPVKQKNVMYDGPGPDGRPLVVVKPVRQRAGGWPALQRRLMKAVFHGDFEKEEWEKYPNGAGIGAHPMPQGQMRQAENVVEQRV